MEDLPQMEIASLKKRNLHIDQYIHSRVESIKSTPSLIAERLLRKRLLEIIIFFLLVLSLRFIHLFNFLSF